MFSSSDAQTPRDRRNLRWIAITQILWVACLLANGTTFTRQYPAGVAALVSLLPMLVGALVIWAYVRYVRQTDDLQKLIQLGGLAFGFGVMVVFTNAYEALERQGLPQLEPRHYAGIGVLAYAAAAVFYKFRYK